MVRSQSLDGNTFHSSTPSDVTGGGDGEFPLEKHRWERLPCTLGCWAVEGGAFNGGLHRGEQALAAAHMPARRDRRVYRRRQADWTDIARKIFCTPPHRRRGGRLGGRGCSGGGHGPTVATPSPAARAGAAAGGGRTTPPAVLIFSPSRRPGAARHLSGWRNGRRASLRC